MSGGRKRRLDATGRQLAFSFTLPQNWQAVFQAIFAQLQQDEMMSEGAGVSGRQQGQTVGETNNGALEQYENSGGKRRLGATGYEGHAKRRL